MPHVLVGHHFFQKISSYKKISLTCAPLKTMIAFSLYNVNMFWEKEM